MDYVPLGLCTKLLPWQIFRWAVNFLTKDDFARNSTKKLSSSFSFIRKLVVHIHTIATYMHDGHS